jgi:hypothetical protein
MDGNRLRTNNAVAKVLYRMLSQALTGELVIRNDAPVPQGSI